MGKRTLLSLFPKGKMGGQKREDEPHGQSTVRDVLVLTGQCFEWFAHVQETGLVLSDIFIQTLSSFTKMPLKSMK